MTHEDSIGGLYEELYVLEEALSEVDAIDPIYDNKEGIIAHLKSEIQWIKEELESLGERVL